MKKSYLFFMLWVSLSKLIFAQNDTPQTYYPQHSELLFMGITKPLKDTKPVLPAENLKNKKKPKEIYNNRIRNKAVYADALPKNGDPVRQSATRGGGMPANVLLNYDGINNTNVIPPDPSGDIGTSHYIEMVNAGNGSLFQVFDKQTGATVYGPALCNTFWQQFNETGLGDPIILYDQQAQRWLLTEFSAQSNKVLIAVSQTNDPAGQWYAYQFTTPDFPDYPKYAIWNNAYLLTTNEGGTNAPVYALERSVMLNGGANPRLQRFGVPKFGIDFQVASAVDWDGNTAPPAGSPAYVMRMYDDSWAGGTDHLEMWNFNIDWTTPANSTLTGPININTAPFESALCSAFGQCVTLGNGNKIDALEQILMHRVQYRNFGSYEAIVCCHAADVSGTDQSGVRWYELRKPNGGAWSIYQQGTYAPDSHSRFMGSIAMDASGNIAMGYSIASATKKPSLCITGRRAGDPLGQMTVSELEFGVGTANPSGSRWGDYSQMGVDPSDGRTFWYVGEYQPAGGWATRIISFQLRQDTNDIAPIALTSPISSPNLTNNETVQVEIRNFGLSAQSNYTVSYSVNGSPYTTETVTNSLAAGDSYLHTFAVPANLATVNGVYNFKIYTNLNNDSFRGNDTLSATVKHYTTNDAQPLSSNLENTVVCGNTAIFDLNLKNAAGAPLTSAKINYRLNGAAWQVYTWAGNIPPFGTTTVSLTVNNLIDGANTIDVQTELPNATADQDNTNDSLTIHFTAKLAGKKIKLELLTDNFPEETSWDLKTLAGATLYTGDNYTQNRTTYTENFCLDDACYNFTIYDSEGDGLQYNGVVGNYQIKDENNALLAKMLVTNGNFGSQEINRFCTTPVICNVQLNTTPVYPTPGNTDGSITAVASNGTPPYQYRIGAAPFGTNNVFTNLGSNTYRIIVKDALDCRDTVFVPLFSVGVQGVSKNEILLQASPNPTNGTVHLKMPAVEGMMRVNIEILDATGRIISRSNLQRYDNDLVGVISLDYLPAGVYFVRIRDEKINQYIKLVKE